MKIQHIALYICLLVFGSCQMEIPALKTLKPCSTTPTIQTTQDATNPSIFKFTLQNIEEIEGTVTWALKYTNATTNLSSQTGSPSVIPSFTVPALNNSAYTLTLSYLTICGDAKTASTAFSAQTPQLSTASSFSLTDPMVHSNLQAVAVANDGTVIANDKNLIKVWNYTTKTLLRTLTGHTGTITDLALSTDEKYLFSSSYSNTIIVYDWKTGAEVRKLTGHTNSVYALAVSADNKYLASCGYDNTLKIWNVADGTLVRTITNTYPMNRVTISNDAQYVTAKYYNNSQYGFKVWNGQTGTELWDSPNSNILSIALSPDGSQLWVAKNNQSAIEKWNTSTKNLTKTYSNSLYSYDLSMSVDGKYLYTGSMAIDIVADKTLYTGKGSNHYQWSPEYCVISANNQYVCSSSGIGSLALCPLSTGDKINNSPSKHPSLIKYAYLSKDKKSLISNDVSSARVWDLATGTEKTGSTSTYTNSTSFYNVGVMTDAVWLKSCSLEKHNLSNGAVTKSININYCNERIAISPDDKFLAIQNSSNTVAIYDASDGTLLKTLSISGTNPSLRYIEFTPDNKYLLTGTYDKTIHVWDVATGALIKTITATTNQIDGGVLSADGMMVAVADYSKVEIYTLSNGALLASINHNSCNAYALAFSPDGKNIAFGNGCSSARVYNIATGILQKEKVLDYAIRNVYYNAAGTQLHVVTERDFQVLNL